MYLDNTLPLTIIPLSKLIFRKRTCKILLKNIIISTKVIRVSYLNYQRILKEIIKNRAFSYSYVGFSKTLN